MITVSWISGRRLLVRSFLDDDEAADFIRCLRSLDVTFCAGRSPA